jgi:hypothetical protein
MIRIPLPGLRTSFAHSCPWKVQLEDCAESTLTYPLIQYLATERH